MNFYSNTQKLMSQYEQTLYMLYLKSIIIFLFDHKQWHDAQSSMRNWDCTRKDIYAYLEQVIHLNKNGAGDYLKKHGDVELSTIK